MAFDPKTCFINKYVTRGAFESSVYFRNRMSKATHSFKQHGPAC
ncbi:hypothetical protein HMPREF9069_00210, partial [Atopobium sp. oral taxon 810 str. F0209]